MALSENTKGFWFRKNMVGGTATPPLQKYIIANSETVTIGDSVTISSGFSAVCGASDRVVGVVEGIIDADGLSVFGHTSNADHDGTVTGDDTYAASADNQTDKQVMIQVSVPRENDLYYNDANGDLSQSNVGQYFDMTASGDQIDQATAGATGVWQLLEIDPDNDGDASKGLFRIAESELQNA